MSFYTFALFVHVCGAIGIFAGLGVWLFGVAVLRRVERVEQVRLVIGPLLAAGNLVVGSILALAAAGIYMAVTAWADARPAWILVATTSFLLLAPVGAFLLDPRLRAVAALVRATADGPLPAALAAGARDPVLGAGLRTFVAVLLGIVFLMTTKPQLMEALLAMGVAAAVGVASGVPLWFAARGRGRTTAPGPGRI
jgi:hypothetical protein